MTNLPRNQGICHSGPRATGRTATERMAITGQIQRDNQLDTVSSNLVAAGQPW